MASNGRGLTTPPNRAQYDAGRLGDPVGPLATSASHGCVAFSAEERDDPPVSVHLRHLHSLSIPGKFRQNKEMVDETISFVKYAWYKQGLRAPYMQIMNYDATGDIATIHQKYTLVANVTVGVDELSKPTLSFSVFPNPVGDTAEIDITIDQNADMAIRLMDIAGKVVMTEKTYYTKGTHHLSMDVSNLPKGIYILSIKGGATVREEQIVIAE